jgi:hypothetical protein
MAGAGAAVGLGAAGLGAAGAGAAAGLGVAGSGAAGSGAAAGLMADSEVYSFKLYQLIQYRYYSMTVPLCDTGASI